MVTEQALVGNVLGMVLGLYAGYVGLLLLRLRPSDRARSVLALGLLALAPGPFVTLDQFWPTLHFPLLALFAAAYNVAWAAGIVFLAMYPTPIRWRSWGGAVVVAALAYAALSLALDPWIKPTGAPWDYVGYGVFSWQKTTLTTLFVFASVLRARKLDAPQRRVAVRVLTALSALAILSVGYSAIGDANLLLNGPLDPAKAHYYSPGPATTYEAVVGIVQAAFPAGLFLVLAIGHRERAAWALVALGALAYLLDQVSPHDLIDIGLANLVTPTIILRAATHDGALGVPRVPARMQLPVAAAGGIAALISVLSVADLAASQQPLVLTLALVLGVAAGVGVTYALRPKGVTLTITRTGEAPLGERELTPGTRIGQRYRLERRLGEGGEGEAWLARDAIIDRPVVLKSVRPGGVREARIVGSIDHANVVRVYDVIESGGVTFLVLEHVGGGDLRRALERRGKLEPDEARRILTGVLDGLGAVHARGVVHGDLKPENVLLSESGVPKLADFGVARRSASSTILAGAGTLAYMSPEQVRGADATPRSDLYAAALLYRELLTGERPAAGLDDVQQRALLARRELAPLEGAAGAFLARALATDPDARFESAAQMRAALHAATHNA